MKLFEAPSRLRKLSGEPVKQGRICGSFSLMSQISRHCGERFSQMLLPDPVHHGTQKECVIFIGEPPGKSSPIRLSRAAKETRYGSLDLRAWALEVTANEDRAGGHAFGENTHARAKRLAFFGHDGVIKKGAQAIKVGLTDGIIRMIMTLRAADGEPQSDTADGGGDVIQQNVPTLGLVIQIGHVWHGKQKPGGRFMSL